VIPEARARAVAEELEALLESAQRNPDMPVAALAIMNDEARAIRSEHRIGREEAAGELHFVRIGRDRLERNRLQPVARRVGAVEHRENAGHRERGALVKRADARMRVRRAHDARVRLPGKIDVVGVATLAAQETIVFLAAERLSDPSRRFFQAWAG